MRFLFLGIAALSLAACDPKVPNSAAGVTDTGRGVGFGSYEDYERARDSRLEGTATTIPGPVDVRATPLDDAAANNSGVAPIEASPANPAPAIASNAVGISSENDFGAVSEQRDIKADADLIARNRAQYQVVAPTDLPTRTGSNRPNVVEYALRTTNPVGTALYKRSRFNADRKYARACGEFTSSDLAQEEFLALGGPEKDRKGMDPDGDGFACKWSPAPFRAARSQ